MRAKALRHIEEDRLGRYFQVLAGQLRRHLRLRAGGEAGGKRARKLALFAELARDIFNRRLAALQVQHAGQLGIFFQELDVAEKLFIEKVGERAFGNFDFRLQIETRRKIGHAVQLHLRQFALGRERNIEGDGRAGRVFFRLDLHANAVAVEDHVACRAIGAEKGIGGYAEVERLRFPFQPRVLVEVMQRSARHRNAVELYRIGLAGDAALLLPEDARPVVRAVGKVFKV